MIDKAQKEDLEEILELQYWAYQSEAKLFGDMDIPPLKQTLEEVYDEFQKGIILKEVDDKGVIIGSVRRSKARHRHRRYVPSVDSETVKGSRGHEKRKRRVESSRYSYHGVLAARMCQPLFKSHRLNRQNLLAAHIPVRLRGRDERRPRIESAKLKLVLFKSERYHLIGAVVNNLIGIHSSALIYKSL